MVSKAIEVTKEVNMWVEKETDGLIEEVLSPGSVTLKPGSSLQMQCTLKEHGMRSLML
jgi:hypothetical protein